MTHENENTPTDYIPRNIFPTMTRDQRVEAQDKLKNLCALLADCLHTNNGNSAASLTEQAPVLNALFHTIISDKLDILSADGAPTDPHTQDWLKLALQIQKQCVDTIKTEHTVQYMDIVSTLMSTKCRNPFNK